MTINESIYLQDNPNSEQKLLHRLAAGETRAFWQLFQQYRDYLFRCCLKWTNGNSTEAEDLLSQATLKAWEKVQKYAGKIENFKAWVTMLIRNFWIDLKRRPCANQVEDIEVYAEREDLGLVSVGDTPAIALEREDKKMVIRRAIDNLQPRLRETFILHFYEELSYQEIGDRQNITYQNVCKRISQARAILRLELRGYFIGEDGTDTGKSVPPTATESAIGEMSQENAPVEVWASETVTLPEAVEEVESVAGEEAQEVVRDRLQSELMMVAATSERKLEVKTKGCRCIEVTLCELLLAPIPALTQFDEESRRWGIPFYLLRRQQQLQVGKVAGEFLRSSRSPLLYCFSHFQSLVKSMLGMIRGKFLLRQNSETDD